MNMIEKTEICTDFEGDCTGLFQGTILAFTWGECCRKECSVKVTSREVKSEPNTSKNKSQTTATTI
jgi:hypothetical protein